MTFLYRKMITFMKDENLTETVHAKVTPEMKDAYLRLANENGRTLSGWIRRQLDLAVKDSENNQ